MDSVVVPAKSGSAGVVWSAKSPTSAPANRVLLFQSGAMHFGVATDSVVEVIESPNCHQVSGAPHWFAGLSVYKSTPVPAIAVGQYFEHDPSLRPQRLTQTESSRAIVVKLAGSYFLLLADKIMNLVNLPTANNAQLSDHGVLDIEGHRAVQRVCQHEGKVISVINLPELFRLTKLLRECR